jgi:hypothetical protein
MIIIILPIVPEMLRMMFTADSGLFALAQASQPFQR